MSDRSSRRIQPATRRPETARCQRSVVVLAALAVVVGVGAGVLGAAFRLVLVRADRLRDLAVAWSGGHRAGGMLAVTAACAAAAALAAWMVRRFAPAAEGSGIPHVEGVLRHELPAAPYALVPVKFVGGLLAIGAGLALGREGPSVQMGASTGHVFARLVGCNEEDCRILLAAGAGAGLATAFNAPIAGAAFVLEELVQRFDTRVTIATLGASAGGIAVARVMLGHAPDFAVRPLPYVNLGTLIVYLALGVLAGLLGVAYNRAILGTLGTRDRFHRMPWELRAALVGAAVGLTACVAPGWVGGGDAITQRTLSGLEPFAILPLLFLFRFALGAVSYASHAPGGLFAPLLTLGAQAGLLFATLCSTWLPAGLAPDPTVSAVVGMAAFFSAVVRAPLTGIILVTEMTASVTLLLPMLASCCAAMAIPELFGNPPIYESLRARALDEHRRRRIMGV